MNLGTILIMAFFSMLSCVSYAAEPPLKDLVESNSNTTACQQCLKERRIECQLWAMAEMRANGQKTTRYTDEFLYRYGARIHRPQWMCANCIDKRERNAQGLP